MYGKVWSACLQGIDGQLIEVEIDISNGLPHMMIVGLPDSAIRESIERVRSSVKNCGYEFPMERITVNLAPADIRKEGSAFDLAIAVGILITSGQLKLELPLSKTLIIGELALDGSIRPVPGVLSMAHSARMRGFEHLIVAEENAAEAMLVDGIHVFPLSHLKQLANLRELSGHNPNLINDINNKRRLEKSAGDPAGEQNLYLHEDYADVAGQHQAKRALIIAASGMHNILFIGPPGTGKTMLMRRIPSIIGDLTDEEALEVTKIHSVAGLLNDRTQLIRYRPFRSPHHTVSAGGLIGGGSVPKPGEVSLAHRGILFLDELPEFTRNVLEVLRQPLEDRHVTIGRARAVYTFPSHFVLAASMNPCPCGFRGVDSDTHHCACSPLKIRQYRGRISGPLLDRIDLQVEVPRIEYSEQQAATQDNHLSSSDMKKTVTAAQTRQAARYQGTGIRFNSELAGKLLRKYCNLKLDSETFMKQCYDTLGLSMRGHDRILKIARTIADIEGQDDIELQHIAEAVQYRQLDREK